MRILLAGLAGAIVMFVWSSVAHLSPLGAVGVQALPHESATVDALNSTMDGKDGLFVFPAAMDGKTSSAAGAGGVLIYHPNMPLAVRPANLIIEFLTELAESLIAAWLLAQAAIAGYAMRVGFVAVIGVVGAIVTNIPYWNWYGFPAAYTLVYGAIQIVAFAAAGLAIAALVKPKAG